jgi:hypothetical protein
MYSLSLLLIAYIKLLLLKASFLVRTGGTERFAPGREKKFELGYAANS